MFYGKNALVHADKSSNTPWAKLLGFENRDVYPKIAATPDGGFLVDMSITRTITETINKFVLAKFNAQNVLQWVKTIQFDENTTTSIENYDFSVGNDGNILFTGTVKELNATAGKFFYLFLNANGNRIRSFYFNETHIISSICSRLGGGFAAIAALDSSLDGKYRFMLFDAQGQLTASKSYRGDPFFYRNGISLVQKNNGGFVGSANAGIVEFDSTGSYLKSMFASSGGTNFGYTIYGPVYTKKEGSHLLYGSYIDGVNGYPAFFVFDNTINMYYLREGTGPTLNIGSSNNGGITLFTSTFRANFITGNPPLKVFEYAVNAAFDKTDCGLQTSRATIPSISSGLTRINLPDLVATNLNPIISTLTNGSLQLTNFNVAHSPLCASVGVSETDLNSNITISPNPSNDVFRIKLENQSADLQRLTVYNNLGQVILDKKESNWETPLSIEQSGTYIVKIQTNLGSILKKIVKVD
jgi:Secretion system C-terminal sorting domain